MNKHKLELLYGINQISDAINELGERIVEDYTGKIPIILSVLKGGLIFTADLIREFPDDFEFELQTIITRSYYETTKSSEDVEIITDGKKWDWIIGRDVIIVDDVADTCYTIKALYEFLKALGALTVVCCVMVEKPARRTLSFEPFYYGIKHESDDFLVGYGMGYGEKYRNMNQISKVIFEEEPDDNRN